VKTEATTAGDASTSEANLRPAEPFPSNPRTSAVPSASAVHATSLAAKSTTDERSTRVVKRDVLTWECIDLSESLDLRHGVRHGVSSVFVGIVGDAGNTEWLSTNDDRFLNRFRALCYQRLGRGPTDAVIGEVVANINARGYGLPQEPITRRVLAAQGKVWVFLGPDSPDIVEIGPGGWSITTKAPGLFLPPDNAATMPLPTRGGSVDDLRRMFPNVDDDGWRATVGFVISTYLPHGPLPVLSLNGPQNCGKSMTTQTIRWLCDPLIGVDARGEMPKKAEDLFTIADQAHTLTFDNLSGLPLEMSDALCRVTTGGARQCRRLYRQGVLNTLRARNPVIVNGITPGVEREDLVSRCVFVELRAIEEKDRLKEAELERMLRNALPGALGAIFDGVALALQHHTATTVRPCHRLEDAACFVTAAEPALGYHDGSIVSAWLASQQAVHDKLTSADPVVEVLDRVLGRNLQWQGTASKLVQDALSLETDDGPRLPSDFPKTASRLGDYLRRRTEVLARSGYTVKKSRTGDARILLIERVPLLPKTAEVKVTRPGPVIGGVP